MKKLLTSVISTLILTGCATNDLTPITQSIPSQSQLLEVPVQPQQIKQTVNTPTDSAKITTNTKKTDSIETKRVNITENYNTGNILVGIKQPTDLNKATEIAGKYNLKVDNFIKGINTISLTSNGQNVPDLIKKLSNEKIFTFVETDALSTNKPEAETDIIDSLFSLSATDIVNDKYFKDQYGLINTHVTDAWTTSTGKNVTIAIIDSGVDFNHADLKNKMVPGYDAFDRTEGAKGGNASKLNYISDTYKHGSHVAGIAAAEANNGKGIAGVAPDAKIMPVKIFPSFKDFFKTAKNADGSDVTVISAIADGIVWAVDHKADVINMSLGVWEQSLTLEKAVKYALDHNVPVVVAAGNERASGNKRNYLAAISGVIAVGATDSSNQITYFSNSGDYVSVAAPGLDIVSTTPSILKLKEYRKMSGTSMASPLVAGIVALIKSKFGATATPEWIKERLQKTATDLGAPGRDDLYGFGLVNANKALTDPVDN